MSAAARGAAASAAVAAATALRALIAAARRPGAAAASYRTAVRIVICCVAWSALAATLAAADAPTWRYLPPVGYEDEPLCLELAGAAGWRLLDERDVALDAHVGDDGVLRAAPAPRGHARLRAVAPDGAAVGVVLVRPGEGAGLALDGAGLRLGREPAVLVLERIDAREDRRWATLRRLGGDTATPCARALPEATVLAQAVAAQAVDARGQGVLVRLSGADRSVGWKHRDYREAVAWIVADLVARGAKSIVLVEPPAPAADDDLARPLARAVRDVAEAYRCRTVATAVVAEARYWEIAPGLLGATLNAAGEARLREVIEAVAPGAAAAAQPAASSSR